MKVNTVKAMERLKTAGTFLAGGLLGGLIAGALQHGWGQMVSNGLDPFGDGGKAVYKETNASRGTAVVKVGFAVRPLTTGGGQGEHFSMTAIPTYLIPPAEAASTSATPISFRQEAVSPLAGHSLRSPQPVTVTHKSSASRPKPSKAKPNKMNSRQRVAGGASSGKNSASHNASSRSAATAQANWVAKLMPGTPAPAVYYSYNAKPSLKEKAAPAHSWAGKLMTDGNQAIKVNAGKVGIHTQKKSDLHSGAGQTGKALSGGSGDFPVWSNGKKAVDGVTVCIKDECV